MGLTTDTVPRISPNGDGSKWGITDLYEDWRKTLWALFRNKGDFEASWGSKKEIVSCKLQARGDTITVTVVSEHDEGIELVDDARWTVYYEQFKDAERGALDIETFARNHYGLDQRTERQLIRYIYDSLQTDAYFPADVDPLQIEAYREEVIPYRKRANSKNLMWCLRTADRLWEECSQELKTSYAALCEVVKETLEEYRREPFPLEDDDNEEEETDSV